MLDASHQVADSDFLRAVRKLALPCSDRYVVDWRGPQTQRREFCISPLQRVLRETLLVWGPRRPRANRQGDSEPLRETRTQTESASSPGIASSKILARRWTLSRTSFSLSLCSCFVHHDYFLLARKGCGRRCATLIGKGSGSIRPHTVASLSCAYRELALRVALVRLQHRSLWATWRS